MFAPAILFLLAALATPARAASLCVAVDTPHEARTYSLASADSLRIAFAHSIYDSRVEERFEIGATGFVPVDVRYSERRLADFYGHESARRDGDWWIVRLPAREFSTLAIRAGSDAMVQLTIGARTITVTDGGARLAPGACSRPASND